MTRKRPLILIAACVVLFGFAGAAHAATNARLLHKFQPVTRFDSKESFRPMTVESFIADSDLERFNGSSWVIVDASPSSSTLPTSGAGWRLNNQYCAPYLSLGDLTCYESHAAAHDDPQIVYGRVARLDNRIVLQYWYYYYDNL